MIIKSSKSTICDCKVCTLNQFEVDFQLSNKTTDLVDIDKELLPIEVNSICPCKIYHKFKVFTDPSHNTLVFLRIKNV